MLENSKRCCWCSLDWSLRDVGLAQARNECFAGFALGIISFDWRIHYGILISILMNVDEHGFFARSNHVLSVSCCMTLSRRISCGQNKASGLRAAMDACVKVQM